MSIQEARESTRRPAFVAGEMCYYICSLPGQRKAEGGCGGGGGGVRIQKLCCKSRATESPLRFSNNQHLVAGGPESVPPTHTRAHARAVAVEGVAWPAPPFGRGPGLGLAVVAFQPGPGARGPVRRPERGGRPHTLHPLRAM